MNRVWGDASFQGPHAVRHNDVDISHHGGDGHDPLVINAQDKHSSHCEDSLQSPLGGAARWLL